ncbi:serine hydrolase domain-containing protein [Nocardia sp. CA-290969]|uniref:serine hydrolase domain-containing protein n=1 Tax=Nocardia sp. CA-290969 TaxID=3239986 RepID=UPI003D8FCE6B
MRFPPENERRWSDRAPLDAGTVAEMAEASADPGSLVTRASVNPAGSYHKPEVLAGGWPGSGLVTTARALAGFYRDLTAGRLLPAPDLRAATAEQVRGRDAVLLLESAFGLGFMLHSQNFVLPAAARATAFGHPGAVGVGDLEHEVAFAFLPNLRRDWLAGDRRAHDLIEQVYAAL